jgi:hypothetical protein
MSPCVSITIPVPVSIVGPDDDPLEPELALMASIATTPGAALAYRALALSELPELEEPGVGD